MPSDNLSVTDFTNAVNPLLAKLDELLAGNNAGTTVNLSDVKDKLGRQYVDLVQEGGGVHGIALAGYTYVLEKKGVSFMKMAGTSAGSINTLLLSSVVTKDELNELRKCTQPQLENAIKWEKELRYDPTALNPDHYYNTRSEKLVELLSRKDLRELVDGHKSWRKVLLNVFKGEVDFKVVKSYFFRIGKWGLVFALFNLLLIVFSFILSIDLLKHEDSSYKWMVGPAALILLIAAMVLIGQMIYLRNLYKRSARFGVNKGDDFENWIRDKLVENNIASVSQLKSKLQLERICLQPRYSPEKKVAGPKYPDNDDWYNRLQAVAGELKTHVLPKDHSQDEFNRCEESLKLINFKLVALARSLPDDAIKQERATHLLQLFYSVIDKEQQLYALSESGDIKTSLDKEIAIVCADITNGIKVEFPAMHKAYWGEKYNISPACYVRASMSVPFFFKPYKIDLPKTDDALTVVKTERKTLLKTNGLKKDEGLPYSLLVDGGLLSNFPVNIFFNPDIPIPSKPTIGVKLEFESETPSKNINSVAGFAGKLVSTMRYFYDRDFISRHAMFRKTVRSIDTGKVHWLNFALTDEDQIELFFRGALTAAIFLLQTQKRDNLGNDIGKLATLGKNVKLRETAINIYKKIPGETFQTEDLNPQTVSFTWEDYKLERLYFISEERKRTARLKRSASYADNPTKESDQQTPGNS